MTYYGGRGHASGGAAVLLLMAVFLSWVVGQYLFMASIVAYTAAYEASCVTILGYALWCWLPSPQIDIAGLFFTVGLPALTLTIGLLLFFRVGSDRSASGRQIGRRST